MIWVWTLPLQLFWDEGCESWIRGAILRCRKKAPCVINKQLYGLHPMSMSWHDIEYTEEELWIFDTWYFLPASCDNVKASKNVGKNLKFGSSLGPLLHQEFKITLAEKSTTMMSGKSGRENERVDSSPLPLITSQLIPGCLCKWTV